MLLAPHLIHTLVKPLKAYQSSYCVFPICIKLILTIHLFLNYLCSLEYIVQFFLPIDCAQKCPRPKKGERVCDSNGRPYPSQCIFENKKCINGELEIGECPGKGKRTTYFFRPYILLQFSLHEISNKSKMTFYSCFSLFDRTFMISQITLVR